MTTKLNLKKYICIIVLVSTLAADLPPSVINIETKSVSVEAIGEMISGSPNATNYLYPKIHETYLNVHSLNNIPTLKLWEDANNDLWIETPYYQWNITGGKEITYLKDNSTQTWESENAKRLIDDLFLVPQPDLDLSHRIFYELPEEAVVYIEQQGDKNREGLEISFRVSDGLIRLTHRWQGSEAPKDMSTHQPNFSSVGSYQDIEQSSDSGKGILYDGYKLSIRHRIPYGQGYAILWQNNQTTHPGYPTNQTSCPILTSLDSPTAYDPCRFPQAILPGRAIGTRYLFFFYGVPDGPTQPVESLLGTLQLESPDLNAAYIARFPRYDYDAVKNNPFPGDSVTFEAHVANRGQENTGDFEYQWFIDGEVVEEGWGSNLIPGETTTFELPWTWQNGSHLVGFVLDPSNLISEVSELNNQLEDRTNGLPVGFWVEQSTYDWMNEHQVELGLGSVSWDDWAQRQLRVWNQVFAESIHPLTPDGVLDRVRLEKVVIVPDGSLPLQGQPRYVGTNYPDTSDKTVDLMWGFLSDLVTPPDGWYLNDPAPLNVEPSLLHELSHARYLIDLYALNVGFWTNNLTNGIDSTATTLSIDGDWTLELPAYLAVEGELIICDSYDNSVFSDCQRGAEGTTPRPHAQNALVNSASVRLQDGEGNLIVASPDLPLVSIWNDHVYYNRNPDDMMHTCNLYYEQHSAYAWNRKVGERAKCGNYNSPCDIGVYIKDLPTSHIFEIRGEDGYPLAGAQVELHEDQNTSWYDKLFIKDPTYIYTTDGNGRVEIDQSLYGNPDNPNNLVLLKISWSGGNEYRFFEVTDANEAYWAGHTQSATYILQMGLTIFKDAQAIVGPSDPITYTLKIKNTRTSQSTNIEIQDTIPEGATYQSGGTLIGNKVYWEISDLAPEETKEVQFTVTAQETIANTEYRVDADGGLSSWSPSPWITWIGPPGDFNKISPVDGSIETTDVTLVWQRSNSAATYEYCYDTTNDNMCSQWINNGIKTSVELPDLMENTTYYWHVCAINSFGTTYSNGSDNAFWSFTTQQVDTEPPTVSWISPVTNEQVYTPSDPNGTVLLEATATDNVAIDYVHFYRWDAVNLTWVTIGDDTTSPYQVTIDARLLNYGWNQINVIAYDTSGNGSDYPHIWIFRVYPPFCPNCGLADSPWPMFRQNLQHTAQSSLNGPLQPETKWSYNVSGYNGTAPAVGADGTIYVGLETSLYAFNPDGSVKWSYPTSDIFRSPLISSNGTIYAGNADGKVYALNPNGSLKWTFTTGGWTGSSPTISADGQTLYIGSSDGYFYAIDMVGNLEWKYFVGSWINPSAAIDGGGAIYFGSTNYNIYALNYDGTLRWSYQTEGFVDSSPAIGPDGTIYIGSLDSKLYALTNNGALKWSYTSDDGIWASPAIANDESIYFGSNDFKLYALDSSGNLKWSYLTGEIVGSPAIGQDGTIFVCSNDLNLYAINPDGTLLWEYPACGGSHGPVIGQNGVIYVNSGSSIRAIQESTMLITPSNLSAISNSQTHINLFWQDNSNDETNFLVERSLDGFSNWTEIAIVSSNSTLYFDNDLNCGTIYYYRVRAYRNSDNSYSEYSNIDNTITYPCDFGKLNPPDKATNITTNPTLSWESSSGATSYEYCYDTSNDNSCSPWLGAVTNTSVSISTLSPNVTYYWHVLSKNSSGSTFSDGNSTTFWSFATQDEPIEGLAAQNDGPTTLGGVTNLSATITAGSNVTYEWDFGDGSPTQSGSVVSHVYPAVAIYTATVTATNSVSTQSAITEVTIEDTVTCTLTWQAEVTVEDSSPQSTILTIGQGPTATDGLDEACGESRLPPKPPKPGFDARFNLPGSTDDSKSDYRNDSDADIEWRLEFQPDVGGYPFTFTWNPAELPSGTWRLRDLFDIEVSVDMKAESSYTLTNTDHEVLIIEHHREICFDVSVNTGWNMSSIPVQADDMTLSAL